MLDSASIRLESAFDVLAIFAGCAVPPENVAVVPKEALKLEGF
jgi:hypothetical protein